MFKKFPTAIAHKNCANDKMYVAPEYIISNNNNKILALKKFCPHRMYPLGTTGEHLDNLVCNLHGFAFNSDGSPINNTKNLGCSNIYLGKSGILFRDFVEPTNAVWVDDLAKETNLVYSHVTSHTSSGSWLWCYDVAIDLFHVKQGNIHPLLMQQVDTSQFKLDEGNGWGLQDNGNHGWWLFVYPFTFIEYSNPGCLAINTIVPNDKNNEYGFDWHTQYYYNRDVHADRRIVFETLDLTYSEDVKAAELQKGNYFPLKNISDPLEKHCMTFGNWITENLINV